jgi:hypothetical protein
MPPKKRVTFGKSSAAKRMKAKRADEARIQRLQGIANQRRPETRELRLRKNTDREAARRQRETDEERELRLRKNTDREAARRQREADEERELRLRKNADRQATRRQKETDEERELRLRKYAERDAARKQQESYEERKLRLQKRAKVDTVRQQKKINEELRFQTNALRASTSREQETDEEHELRLQRNSIRTAVQRQQTRSNTSNVMDWSLSGFNYNPNYNYTSDRIVLIGRMSSICQKCNANKWPRESPGLCCFNGKVDLPVLAEPPEPLKSFLSGITPESVHFLRNIQAYNTAFSMTSFGANLANLDGDDNPPRGILNVVRFWGGGY